jgi:hypothetical protein
VPAAGESIADRVADAAARTVAAGTARLFAAWCSGSSAPDVVDRRCDGVADLAARRTHVSQSVFFTDRLTAKVMEQHGPELDLPEIMESEIIFDGPNAYYHVADAWTVFFPADADGPRGPNDPLWPLDALFGAGDDTVVVGPEAVRGVAATHCRLTVDLVRADAGLPAGVSVPAGPYRSLRQLPAEVWLDAAGLARRISVNSDPTGAAEKQIWSVLELWDFGVSVDITPPGPDEVIAPYEAYRRAEEAG